MDRKPKRTDLLAAGRQKLQQYRHNKDNKAKDGKPKDGKPTTNSSTKPDQSNHRDADADATLDSAPHTLLAESSHHSDPQLQSDSSVPVVPENPSHTSVHSHKVLDKSADMLSASNNISSIVAEEAVLGGHVRLSAVDPVSVDTSLHHNFDSRLRTGEGEGEMDGRQAQTEADVSSSSTEVEAAHDKALPPGLDYSLGAACDAEQVAVETEGLQDGDQEVDNVGREHCDKNVELELERDGGLLSPPPEGDGNSAAVPDDISDKLTAPEQQFDVSATSISDHNDDRRTGEVTVPADATDVAGEAISANLNSLHQQGDDVFDGSAIERALSLKLTSENQNDENQTQSDRMVALQCANNFFPEESIVGEHEVFGSTKEQSLCPGEQENCIDMIKLAEILKRLPEGDFRYLIRSREIAGCGNLNLSENVMADLPETFQEQLYLANISRDFFQLQLLEQQLDLDHQHQPASDGEPVHTALLSKFQESNETLAAQLAECRSELDAVIGDRVEYQNMYHNAKEEAVGFSGRVDELTIKLEEAVRNLSSVCTELVDCKAQLEGSQLEKEKLLNNLASVSEQWSKHEEVMEQLAHEKQKLSMDLADSSSEFAALQQEIENLKINLASVTDERKKFQEEKEILVHEKEMLSGELTDCRNIIIASQQENSDLNMSLTVMAGEHKNLKEHEEFLRQETERLSAELLVYQDKLSIQHQENMKLDFDMKEVASRLELLAEENIILQSTLDIYKAKISEFDSRHIQISSAVMGSEANMDSADIGYSLEEDAATAVTPAPDDVSDSTTLIELRSSFHDDTSVTVMMNGYLAAAQKMMEKLEKATDWMHCHSVSLSRSAGKNAAPGVSKLIQAFESKANVDAQDPESSSSTESLALPDTYSAAKEQISHMKDVLETLAQHVELMDAHIMEEKVRCKAADVARRELEVEIGALKGFSNNLEARNIELEVLCGAMNQHTHDIEANKAQLEDICDSLKGEYAALQSQNSELVEKLNNSYSRISEMQVQLKDIRRSSEEVASTLDNGIETLQSEARQDINAVDREWKAALTELVPIVEKLDTVVGTAVSDPLPSGSSNDLDVFSHLSSSLNNACEVIEKLMMRVEAHDALSSAYSEVVEKLGHTGEERSLAVHLLQKLSADLVKLLNLSVENSEDSEIHTGNIQQDLLDASFYEAIVEKLANLVGDLRELKESNRKLYSELLDRPNDIEELNKNCLDSEAVLKVVLGVKEVLKLQDAEVDLDNAPISCLQSWVLLLIQKYKEEQEQANSLAIDINSKVTEIDKLQGNVEVLNSLHIQQQNEILVLRESLAQGKDGFDAIQAEILEKTKELEQSEKRVASVREKLSIAVAKGKGLVVQRDSLKHSLAEMSSEMEKCSQELRLKDSRLLEVEEKLKACSEPSERIEALEFELTYIRNSATALRESFLMKDSALQRIEEIMEDLELPDHFHSKDIVEKVDWLAKSVAGNSLLPADWDQRSFVGGGSYSDAGPGTDGGKEDTQPTSNPVDDLRRKYDELQTKYYELAEQNDMLEQSLMERNILVQRWEEVLDRINTPPQIRSMEPEERIHWLGTAMSEADQHMRSLQQKIENLENYCESLSSDLEESQRRISEHESSLQVALHEKERALSEADDLIKSLQLKIHTLENDCALLSSDLVESQRKMSEFKSSLQTVLHDKEILSANLVALTSDHELALHTVAQYEHDLDKLREEVIMLQGNVVGRMESEDRINEIESELIRLRGLILDGLQDSGSLNDSSGESNIQGLERLIRRLLNHDMGVGVESHGLEVVPDYVSESDGSSLKVTEIENEYVPVEAVAEAVADRSNKYSEHNVADLKRDLSEALYEAECLREQRDAYLQKIQSVASDYEVLEKKKEELQELLNQEEQKSASLREKLNLAVRKGKSLIQQRDSLKQNIEEMMAEIERSKSEMNSRDRSLSESEQMISDLSQQIETYKALEAENFTLKNRLIEAEQHLQQNGQSLSMLLRKVGEIDVGGEINAHDPLQKLEGIRKLCSQLHATSASFEQETQKSKRAAELLLAELNEVQDRNDGLQEQLAHAYDDISTLTRERDLVESAKVEALSRVAKLSEERRVQLVELERLKSSVHVMKNVFFDMFALTKDVFAKDLEVLLNVKAHMESCVEQIGADPVATKDYAGQVSVKSTLKDFWSRNALWSREIPDQSDDGVGFDVFKVVEQHVQHVTDSVGDFKEKLQSHSMSLRTEAEHLTNSISTILRGITSQKNSLDLIKREHINLESTMKEKDMEGAVLRRCISFLYEACTSSIMEMENRKAQLVGESTTPGFLRVNLPSLPSADGGNFSGLSISSTEDSTKALADKLLIAVKGLVDIESESKEGRSEEMRNTILTLQKELQEKDIQRERICMELVNQIKQAESTAANCARDLQSMKNLTHDLENRLEAVSKERDLLEQKVAELEQGHFSSIELGEKAKALTDVVAAKEQEIESLMQALDEEENQMESLRFKIEELEKLVQQKNTDLELLEASRAKAIKKLCVTVNKFDELHHMSEGLLSEIENLQSQLQDRDTEVSFLRQEVTRCTNDVLEATRMVKERTSDDLHELLMWLDAMFSRVLGRDAHGAHETAKEHIQKDLTSIILELENLRIAAQNKDELLQVEHSKVEELLHRKEALEASLNEKQLRLESLKGARSSGVGTSEIIEVEPVLNKWTAPVTSTASQVRSLRKVNNDQVAIAINTEAGSSDKFDDEDDDKVHGFKSLTTSRFIPKFTRPVSDMIDGLWVSCDRALMRQPALRLGIMIYWALLHAFLASIIV